VAAGPVPDGLHRHQGKLAVAFDRRREDRGPGRRHKLHGHPLRVQGRAAQQLDHGRRRDGHRAVVGPGHAQAGGDRGGEGSLYPEHGEGERGARDVDDRVDRSHLVEGDQVDLLSVHPGLGLGQPPEDPLRQVERVRRECRRVEERADAGVRPDDARGRGLDLYPLRVEPVRFYILHLDVERLEGQLGQLFAEQVEIRPGVDQGGEGHVAGDPGDAVEVRQPHRLSPGSARCDGPRGLPRSRCRC
jgi:hypothetical protein